MNGNHTLSPGLGVGAGSQTQGLPAEPTKELLEEALLLGASKAGTMHALACFADLRGSWAGLRLAEQYMGSVSKGRRYGTHATLPPASAPASSMLGSPGTQRALVLATGSPGSLALPALSSPRAVGRSHLLPTGAPAFLSHGP